MDSTDIPVTPSDSGLAGQPGESGQEHPIWHIPVLSGAILALEMAFIRQIPAEVRVISYFTNLLLMASFFGLGLGCILHRARNLNYLMPAGLALVAGFIYLGRGIVIYGESMKVHYWLQYTNPAGTALNLPLLPAAILVFGCSALPFVALGQALIRAMSPHPILTAYGWDIFGSLVGTALFVASSRVEVPPWLWPVAISVVWAVLFSKAVRDRVAVLAAGALFLVFALTPMKYVWSPYYFVQYQEENLGVRVYVNSSFHQLALDFSGSDGDRGKTAYMMQKFSSPYDVYREEHAGRSPEKVLVLGAGTGNDVNVALKNGAKEIVAVEIDPSILEIGKNLNRTKPYANPKVETLVDDARHYLRSSDRKFDMVVFGTLDSQTLASGVSNLRLDNYVYTTESFADAKKLLVDGGMMCAFYSVQKEWLFGRIYSTIREVFGDQTKMMISDDPFLFNTMILGGNNLPNLRDNPEVVEHFGADRPSTDDWPFIFLEKPTIAPIYQWLFLVLLASIGCVFLLLRRVEPGSGLKANFLFLGLGFTLVESAALVRLSLVFGTTWVVNALVFSAVLTAIYLSNRLVIKGVAPSLRVAWMGLFASLILNYLFPLQGVLALPLWLRILACVALIGLPVVFSAVCFSRLFSREKTPGYALGVNLVGAMAGGLLEWSSMLIGLRAVWLIALAVYIAAFLCTERESSPDGGDASTSSDLLGQAE